MTKLSTHTPLKAIARVRETAVTDIKGAKAFVEQVFAKTKLTCKVKPYKHDSTPMYIEVLFVDIKYNSVRTKISLEMRDEEKDVLVAISNLMDDYDDFTNSFVGEEDFEDVIINSAKDSKKASQLLAQRAKAIDKHVTSLSDWQVVLDETSKAITLLAQGVKQGRK